jgi:hypothetical protein
VWSDEKSESLKPYLARMSIADLREMVGDRVKSSKSNPSPVVRPPASAQLSATNEALDANGLTQRELAICAEFNTPPATFAALKARRTNRAART